MNFVHDLATLILIRAQLIRIDWNFGACCWCLYRNRCPCWYNFPEEQTHPNGKNCDHYWIIIFLKGKQQQVTELNSNILKHTHFSLQFGPSEIYPTYLNNTCFILRCCLQLGSLHPLCLKAEDGPDCVIPNAWFPSGPTFTYLPMPVPDPERCSNFLECGGSCHGHYMKPEDLMMGHNMHEAAPPPSAVIRDFSHQKKRATDNKVTELARRLLLPVRWLAHLQHNRKRWAAQAAITRKAKKAAAKVHALESDPSTISTAKGHAPESDPSITSTAKDHAPESGHLHYPCLEMHGHRTSFCPYIINLLCFTRVVEMYCLWE